MSSLQPRTMAAASTTGAFGLCGTGAGFTAAGMAGGIAAPSGIEAATSATEVLQFADSFALWAWRQANASGPSCTFLHRRLKSERQVNFSAFSLAGSGPAGGAAATVGAGGGAAGAAMAAAGLRIAGLTAAGGGVATLTCGGGAGGAGGGGTAAAAGGGGAGGAGGASAALGAGSAGFAAAAAGAAPKAAE